MTRARDVANLIGSGNYSSTTFTATAGQTVFSIAHTQNFVQVFMNGLLLDLTVDYTSNGSAVTLTSGAAAGDEIEVVAYNTFSVGDALNQAAADTRFLGVNGTLVTTSSNAFAVVKQGTASDTGYAELQILNDADHRLVMGSIGSTYSDGDWSGSRYIYNTAGDLKLKSQVDLEMFSGGNTIANHLTQTMNTSGHITNPRQPMIAGTMGTAMSSPTNDTLLSFNVFFVNRGITFNSTTKRFTVPTAGVYSIMLTPFVYGGSGPHRVLVGKNTDTPLYTTHFGHFYTNQTTYDSGALHSVVELAANDYIVFRLINGRLYNQSNDYFNEFSICKIA